MLKRLGFITIFALIVAGLMGCSNGAQFSPEQVINNAVNQSPPISYYAEAEMKTSGLNGEIEQIKLKEWISKEGQRRTEAMLENGSEQSISVFNGTQFMSYLPETNQLFLINESSDLSELNQISPKDQFMHLLKTIQHSHEITAKGEEEIAGRKAYHLTAKAKDATSLLGDQQIWIDKEHWIILKIVTTTGDIKSEMEYTLFELNPDLPAQLFMIEIPDDAEIIDLDQMKDVSEEVTLEQAVEALGSTFLHFPQTDQLQLARIELLETSGVWGRTEINLDYEKDGVMYFMMSVFPSPEEEDDLGPLPGEQEVEIRNKPALYMDLSGFRSLVWSENGLNYSVMFIDPSLTLESFSRLAEDMVFVE